MDAQLRTLGVLNRPVAVHIRKTWLCNSRRPGIAMMSLASLALVSIACPGGNQKFDEQLDTGWATFIISHPTRSSGLTEGAEGHDLPTSDSESSGNVDLTGTPAEGEVADASTESESQTLNDNSEGAGDDSAATGDADAGDATTGDDGSDTTTTTSTTSTTTEGTTIGASAGSGDKTGDDDGEAGCDWTVRRMLTVTGLGTGVRLLDAPVLIRLDQSRIDHNLTEAGGIDLRFYDPESDVLYDYEIDSWSEDGTSYVWVRFPVLEPHLRLWMYYGWRGQAGAELRSGENAADTWSDYYVGVWHLEDDLRDSSGAGLHGNPNALNSQSGVFAGAQSFNEYSYVDLGIGPFADFSISAWIHMTNSPEAATLLGSSRGSRVYIRGPEAEEEFAGRLALVDDDRSFHTTRAVNLEGWSHLTVSRTGGFLSFFIDGHDAGTAALAGTFNLDRIGYLGSFESSFDGDIDEFRLGWAPQSADWVESQYLSMTDRLLKYSGNEAVVDSCPTLMDSSR